MANGRVVGIRFGAALAALTMLAVSAPTVAANAAQTQPNILIILTDDQRLNGAMFEMPKTLSLFGDGGTQFTNYYDTTPLCCPSRGSIWSGEYAHNHGVLTNGDHPAELAYDQTTTLQSYLQGAGYETAIAGKYWNTWSIGDPPPYFNRYAIMAGSYNDAFFGVDGKVEQVPGYTTDVLGQFARGFLDDFEANDSQPWYLYVAPQAPHYPFTPSTKYKDATLPKWDPNPAFLESDRTDKPPWVQCCTTSLKEARRLRSRQLKTLMSVDDMVGSIFDKLAALGETDTIAMFTSDNGFMWGEHGRIEKRFPYTQSIQVPFFLRWPGHVAAGATDDRLTANIDIEPTILDAVGIAPTHAIDGASLFGPNARARLHLEYFVSPDAPLRSWSSTLTPTYQYIEWYNSDGSIAFREYYDEVNDPWQLTNLLQDGDPSNDPTVPPLHSQVVGDQLCAGATCPKPVPADSVAPSTPGKPSGSSTTSGRVDLTWPASTDNTATTIVYYVFRDTASAPIGSVASASSGTVSFTDKGLAGGSKHTYRVQASDGQNLSPKGPWSAPIVVAA